eukprot:3937065-Rhodomonas_salina.1
MMKHVKQTKKYERGAHEDVGTPEGTEGGEEEGGGEVVEIMREEKSAGTKNHYRVSAFRLKFQAIWPT